MSQPTECDCGSGLYPEAQHDGYGIYLCRTCAKCHKKKMSRYRSDIHSAYDTYGEPIEPDYIIRD